MSRLSFTFRLFAVAVALMAVLPAAGSRPPVGQSLSAEGLPLEVSGYESPSAAEATVRSLPLAQAEGLWEFPQDGGLVAIARRGHEATELLLIAVCPSNRAIRPGTVMGVLRPTAKAGYYEAMLYTSADRRGRLSRPRAFTLVYNAATASLTFERVRKGVKWNWWRMLPYMFRFQITTYDTTPTDLDGLRRVYPPNPSPLQPRYL